MSALKQRIKEEMKAALVGGDRFVGETLRNLTAAVLDEEIKQGVRDVGLSDSALEQVIAREVKKRRDSAAMYRNNDRIDLAELEEREASILQGYLPEPLSEAELYTVVETTISELGVTDIQDMGQVVGAVKAQTGNRANGAEIARLVRQSLTQK